MQEQTQLHYTPVKVYQSDDRLTVAAPMPGLQPEDVVVEIREDGTLSLHGELRGVFKGMNTVLLDEWHVGGYTRELKLPQPVDGELATVTYGNGVLVVTMPLAERTRAARLRLEPLGFAHGERVGSAGHPITATSTEEHRTNELLEQRAEGGGFDPHENPGQQLGPA